MLGLLAVGKMLFKASKLGHAASVVKHTTKAIDLTIRTNRLAEIEQELQKGINRAEDKWSEEQYGGVEPMFAFQITSDEIPDGLEVALGIDVVGFYVFRLSEWTDLWRWLTIIINNLTTEVRMKEGRDGRWMLQYGKARWEDETIKAVALANVDKHERILRHVEGVVRQSSN